MEKADVINENVIKWKHFPRYRPFVRGIHRSPVNSPHEGQWRGALMFTLICARINGWVNSREAGDLRRYRANYDVIVMNDSRFIFYSWYNIGVVKIQIENILNTIAMDHMGTTFSVTSKWYLVILEIICIKILQFDYHTAVALVA